MICCQLSPPPTLSQRAPQASAASDDRGQGSRVDRGCMMKEPRLSPTIPNPPPKTSTFSCCCDAFRVSSSRLRNKILIRLWSTFQSSKTLSGFSAGQSGHAGHGICDGWQDAALSSPPQTFDLLSFWIGLLRWCAITAVRYLSLSQDASRPEYLQPASLLHLDFIFSLSLDNQTLTFEVPPRHFPHRHPLSRDLTDNGPSVADTLDIVISPTDSI